MAGKERISVLNLPSKRFQSSVEGFGQWGQATGLVMLKLSSCSAVEATAYTL
jgi:hypothetical protein